MQQKTPAGAGAPSIATTRKRKRLTYGDHDVSHKRSRREFVRELGLSAAALPFILNLPSLGFAAGGKRKQRMVIMFSPNGVVPWNFWPEKEGRDFALKESLKPLDPFKDRSLILKGVCCKVRGDGDNHMRGMGCLLTGTELFPGNVQGGSHTPAGWASGISIDQEITNFLQSDPATRTRFGSLEFGVMVPDRADTWTRMSYADANQPLTPIDDPYQMFNKLYGQVEQREAVRSVLDDLREDMKKLQRTLSEEDRRLLEEHADRVRDMEQDLIEAAEAQEAGHAVPELEPEVERDNDNMPQLSKMQIDLMVNAFAADFARVATLQYTNSVGQPKMHWIGVDGRHHTLSHYPDSDEDVQNDLTKINKWYCEQYVYLCRKLDETPEPGGEGSMLDNTLVVWTNELGKGNNHTLNDIPFVMTGGNLGFDMGRSVQFPNVHHNRLLMSLAHGFGHRIDTFGNPDFCGEGPLTLS